MILRFSPFWGILPEFAKRESASYYQSAMALYHKYRPQKFSEISGQPYIVQILTNELAENDINHAYLFSGPRGLGKTTTARILAKAVNCAQPNSGEPCNKCRSCVEITSGSSFDVIEIDAASNRGIDEIRQLRDKVKFAPSASPKKVFIIDEVHMLTKEAFNALLKTLEEPPSHVLFILATTEPHKVPDTILSRVQRFDFRRPEEAALTDYAKTISQKEKIPLDESGAGQIAKLASGSFRDALVLLDQTVGFSAGKKITAELIRKILGLPPVEAVTKTIAGLEKNDAKTGLELLKELVGRGTDMTNFGECLINELRAKMRTSGDVKYAPWIVRFLEALGQIKISPEPEIPLELAIIDIAEIPSISASVNQPTNNAIELFQNKPKKVDSISWNPTIWQKLIKYLAKENPSLSAILHHAAVALVRGNKLLINVKYKLHWEKLAQPKNRNLIENIIEQESKHAWQVEFTVGEGGIGNDAQSKGVDLDQNDLEEIFG